MTRDSGSRSRRIVLVFLIAGVFLTAGLFGLYLYGRHIVLERQDARLAELRSRIEPSSLDLEDWQLRTLDGKIITFDRFQGDVVFISFWAAWCRPCIEELPTIQALADHFESGNLSFLLVTDEEEKAVREFVKEHGVRLPVYLASNGVPRELDVHTEEGDIPRPTTVVLDCEGEIAYRHVGSRDWGDDDSRSLVGQLVTDCDG